VAELISPCDPQDWQRVLAVNLLGVVHGIQAFVPHLVWAGAGHVVNIALVLPSSTSALSKAEWTTLMSNSATLMTCFRTASPD
jgi:NADP-dependent 3-hydroxy acid dehydrogenase YdfG